MGFLSGSITSRKYRVADDLPADFREKLERNLHRHAFREINPEKNPELSYGWVNPLDPTVREMPVPDIVIGRYVVLGIRRDTKSVAPAMLKMEMRRALRELARRPGKALPRSKVLEIRQTVKNKMLLNATPQTSLMEMAWNYETGDVWFSTTATKPNVEFVDLFEQTFSLTLVEETGASRAEAYIAQSGVKVDLESLELTEFV